MERLTGCKPVAALSAQLLHGSNTVQICTAAAAPELGIHMSDGGDLLWRVDPLALLMSFSLCCLMTLVTEVLQLCQKGMSCSCVLPVTLWAQIW